MSNYPPHSHHPHFSSRPGQFMGAHSHPHPGFSRFAQTGNAADMDPYTGMPYAMPQGQGFFPGANHPYFNNPMMVDNSTNNVNVFGDGGPVIRRLYEASIKGTEIDSEARHPPPRCHPKTRKKLTTELYTWMENGERKSNLTWIFGFAGVGKTAVAQTVGEWAKEKSLLGAAFFFSRTRNHTDPSRVFISIAHQLAVRDEQYRRFVAHHLSTDFGLLDKDIRTQFKKLLVEPLSELKLDKKLVIIIDGLDECEGQDDQCTIIDLVNGAASSPTPLPVIWMICSRPESQIKQTFFQAVFFQADVRIGDIKKEVPVDDSETKKDIKIFIQDGFKDIVKRFTMQDDGSWPTPEDVDKVVSAASGLFIYASTIVKYVGDPNYDDPEEQLKAVIAFIENSPARPMTESPLYYLDKLYEQIISRVPPRSLQPVLLIIAVSSFYPALPAQQLANLFGHSQMRFYGLLLQLHSVIEVPPADKASKDNIQVFHASFMDFLKNPTRAGRFTLNEQDVHTQFISACLEILGKTKLLYAKKLTWTSKDDPPAFLLAHHILAYCATNVWSACTKLGDAGESRDVIDKIIIDFDFLYLRFVEDKLPVSQFYDFCLWLRKQIQKHNLEDIIQPVTWNTDYLQERFGECTIDSSGNEALRCFTLGKKAKRITVMMSSDQLMLSRED